MKLLNLLIFLASISFAQLNGVENQPTNQTQTKKEGAQSTTEQFHPTQEFYNANQQKLILGLQKGRPIITGMPNFQNGIKFSNTSGSAETFQDGTTQNTAATTTVDVSTFTFLPETSLTQSVFSVAVATVTLVVVNANAPINIQISGSEVGNSNSNEVGWSVLVDSKYPTIGGLTPLGTTNAVVAIAPPASNTCMNVSGLLRIDKLTAGSHTFAIVPAAAAGTVKFIGGTTNCNNGLKVKSSMLVSESH